jgi:hypothetical protein
MYLWLTRITRKPVQDIQEREKNDPKPDGSNCSTERRIPSIHFKNRFLHIPRFILMTNSTTSSYRRTGLSHDPME